MATVIFHDDFRPEFRDLTEEVQDELLAQLRVVEQFGSQAGRPRVDTLNGSRYRNMKELRFSADGGEWRFAFAFDPERNAYVLCGGDKSGEGETKFYRRLIAKADQRFGAHLKALETKGKTEKKR